MKKKTWIILIAVIVFIIGGSFLGVMALKQMVDDSLGQPDRFFGGPSIVVSKGEIKSGIYTSGSVRPAEAVNFPYDPAGNIIFYFENGEEVKKGKILFETKDPEMEFQYEEALINRDRIKTQLDQLKKISAEDPEIEPQVKQLESELAGAQSRVNQLNKMLENNKIKAPFDGVVTLSKDMPALGDGGVAPGYVRLLNPEELIISVPIDEIDFPQVKEGDKVNVSLMAYQDEVFSGSVTYLGREASNRDGRVSFPAIITLEPDERILPGMTADVWVILAQETDILVVPIETVFDGEKGEQYVNVITDEGGIEMRPVKTGISDDNQIEIIEGVREGEMIEVPMRDQMMHYEMW